MELIAVLSDARAEILDEAVTLSHGPHLGHYEPVGPAERAVTDWRPSSTSSSTA